VPPRLLGGSRWVAWADELLLAGYRVVPERLRRSQRRWRRQV